MPVSHSPCESFVSVSVERQKYRRQREMSVMLIADMYAADERATPTDGSLLLAASAAAWKHYPTVAAVSCIYTCSMQLTAKQQVETLPLGERSIAIRVSVCLFARISKTSCPNIRKVPLPVAVLILLLVQIHASISCDHSNRIRLRRTMRCTLPVISQP